MELAKKKCSACEDKNTKPLSKGKVSGYLEELIHWTLDKKGKMIFKQLEFKTFVNSIDFVNAVADIAEMEGHHPDIHIWYNKVRLELSTHSIDGLTENDFIVAAKIDELIKF